MTIVQKKTWLVETEDFFMGYLNGYQSNEQLLSLIFQVMDEEIENPITQVQPPEDDRVEGGDILIHHLNYKKELNG